MKVYTPNQNEQKVITNKSQPGTDDMVTMVVVNESERLNLLKLFIINENEINTKIQKDKSKGIYTYAIKSTDYKQKIFKNKLFSTEAYDVLSQWPDGKALENDDIEDIKEKIEKIDKEREKNQKVDFTNYQKLDLFQKRMKRV